MRVVATAGHVDHGKSSLVQALTGTNPDRFAEEQQRGLTIDLGFAYCALPDGGDVSFIDVPGHIRFVRNMLAGVGGVDACLFVVDVTEGWKPQSEEHLRILDMVGLRHGVIALTKRSLVDDEWCEIARLEIADHVANTFLSDAPIVAVDSIDGTGLDDLRMALSELVQRTPASRDRDRPRLWIDRAFSAKGAGTIVTGTLTGGHIRVDEHMTVVGPGANVRVRGIQTLGKSVQTIGPGNRVALNLSGVDIGDVGRGDVVVASDRWLLTDRVDASLRVLAALDHDVSRRGAYLAYIGSSEMSVSMRVLGADELAPGTTGNVRLYLPRAVPVLPGDRFVLRETGRDETIGGGEILDIDPQTKASIAAPDRSVARVVAERGWITVEQVERLTGEQVPAVAGEWVAPPELVSSTTADLLERVANSGDTGLDVATLAVHERALLTVIETVDVTSGRARLADVVDPFADHPVAAEVLAGGFTPPTPNDRAALRELVRRKILVERDHVFFHRDTVDAAAVIAAQLLAAQPDGFTVAEFRDRTGASRKFALPLVGILDATGVTRRRDDVRIAGRRLPDVPNE